LMTIASDDDTSKEDLKSALLTCIL